MKILFAILVICSFVPNVLCQADIVSSFAGSLQDFRDGMGTNAWFSGPTGVSVDSNGIVYVADMLNNRIRRITPNGNVSTLAGSSLGFKDDIGTNALFRNPYDIAVGFDGLVYVADYANHKIRSITPNGNVSTLAGSSLGFKDDIGTNALFNGPRAITVGPNGIIYVADMMNHRIRRITQNGVVSTIAGNSGGFKDDFGTNAMFQYPGGVALDSNGTIYVADSGNHRIRRITLSGNVSTLAGSGLYAFKDDMGTNSWLAGPTGITIDSNGIVHVADGSNNRIRSITLNGLVRTIAGSSLGFKDDIGTNALFSNPTGVAIDSDGNIYAADSNNQRIRKIGNKTRTSSIRNFVCPSNAVCNSGVSTFLIQP